jgi:hypothetical protein
MIILYGEKQYCKDLQILFMEGYLILHLCINNKHKIIMKKIIICISTLFLISCAGDMGKREAAAVSSQASTPTIDESKVGATSTNNDILSIDNPKLIKQAEMRMEVESLKEKTDAIKLIISNYKGYISSMNFSNTYSTSENSLIIKIPSNQFDLTIDAISKQAKYLESKTIRIDDVSEEYIDVEARIKTKLEVEQRYLDILRNKAKTVKDVLEAEEQLRLIREEIEAKQARLNVLKNQVAYSTLTLSVYEKIDVKNAPEPNELSFFKKTGNALKGGWEFIEVLFLGALYIWPIWILLFIGIYFYRKRSRARKKIS